MRYRTACLAAIIIGSAATSVTANEAVDDDPVLRLRLQAPALDMVQTVQLRPRFDARVTRASRAIPAPKVTMANAGRVGKFAYVSTAHPNVVLAVGATDDASELGRQIDRAILEMTRGEMLFNRQSDSAPFIGVGVRSGSTHNRWSADAAIGVGVFNPPEASRLSAAGSHLQAEAYQAQASAHFRLGYSF